MSIQCWPDLAKYGAREHLQETYGSLLLGEGETEPEYQVSLRIDLEALPAGPGQLSLVDVREGYKLIYPRRTFRTNLQTSPSQI